MKAKRFEEYTITDEIKIGNTWLAIGESQDRPAPYVTLERKGKDEYSMPHYQFERCAAELDLMDRAVGEFREYFLQCLVEEDDPTNVEGAIADDA